MERKLYIINNGLKDLRGHYYETSVSIAEAGRSLGLRPILAAHITCPVDLAPDGIEFHPAFTTDHWIMGVPLPPSPDIGGLRAELAPMAAASIEALRSGAIGFDEYLAARFNSPFGRVEEEAATTPRARSRLPRPSRQQIGRLFEPFVPPGASAAYPRIKDLARQATPPFLWSCLQRLRHGRRVETPAEAPAPNDTLTGILAGQQCPWELAYSARFGQDLERLLALTGCSPDDHVLLPTAHGRELGAIVDLLARWPAELAPTFHLEFRHDLGIAPDGTMSEWNVYGRIHMAFFDYARRFPIDDRVRLYTDTDGLSEEYEWFSGLEFGVLPIPFRSHLLSRRDRGDEPLCLSCIGDMRDEKGFHWLPDLIDAMGAEVRAGRVRFLIQASLQDRHNNPGCVRALDRLQAYPAEAVQLVGLEGPLSPESYYEMISESDVVLCPYDPVAYRNRSSGTLTEAIAAGIPTVAPGGSWLSRQQPPGGGGTFTDRETFIESVRSICADYPTYLSHARAGRHRWLDFHSPERLVRALLGETSGATPAASKVA